MHIFYIHTHDTGKVLGSYGYGVQSPNIDAFANESVKFEQAFCAAPTCSPSRASLLTGMYPHENGMLGLVQRGFALNDTSKHLANFLKQNNYHTVLTGVQHEGAHFTKSSEGGKEIGYDAIVTADISKYDKEEDYVFWDLENVEQAINYVDSYEGQQPLFYSLGLFSTHRKYPKNDGSIDASKLLPPAPLVNNRITREDFAEYQQSLLYADQAFGRFIQFLKEKELYEQSLIIFTTDHGLAVPFAKCHTQDAGIAVALMMKEPFRKFGEQYEHLVSHLDIYPTICEMIGVEKPNYLRGKSLLPIFKNMNQRVNTEVFAEVNFHTSYEPIRSIRTERYKLVKYFDDYLEVNRSNIDHSNVKTFYHEHGMLDRKKEQRALYDLYQDPTEQHNLIDDVAFSGIARHLEEKLVNMMKQTNDPLLDGPLALQPEWKVNKREAYDPSSKNPDEYEK